MSAIKPIRMEIGPISMGSSGLSISVGKNLISIAISLGKKKKIKTWSFDGIGNYIGFHISPSLSACIQNFRQHSSPSFPLYSLSIFIHFYSIQTNTKDKRRSFIIASHKIGQSIIAQSEDSQHNTFTRSCSPAQNGKSQPFCVCVCVCTLVRAIEKPKYASEEENFHIVPIAGDEEDEEEEGKKKKHGKNNHNKYVI